MKRIVVKAQGRVQGVGYRYYVAEYAQQTDLTGFVRNMPDGSVQVIAEGSEDSLLQFIRYLHGAGHPVISVSCLGDGVSRQENYRGSVYDAKSSTGTFQVCSVNNDPCFFYSGFIQTIAN